MSISLVAHTISSSYAAVTTSAIDTSGASILIVSITFYTFGTIPTLSDSKSNTWSVLTSQISDFGGHTTNTYYSSNPTVGSGHTFSTSGAGSMYNTITVAAFSGPKTSSPFETQNGNINHGTTIQPGSVSATNTGDLIICSMGQGSTGGVASIDTSFSITDQAAYSMGSYFGGGLAWLSAPSTSGINPTWSTGSSTYWNSTIAIFSKVTSTAYTKNVSEVISLSEGLKKKTSGKFVEVFSLSDGLKKKTSRKLLEVLTIIDSLKKKPKLSLKDILVLSDSIKRLTERNYVDILSINEILQLKYLAQSIPNLDYLRSYLGESTSQPFPGNAIEQQVNYDDLNFLKGFLD